MKTQSEILFEKFCTAVGIEFKEVPTKEEKTPDYSIFPNGNEVVVEVKQIDPNPTERKEEEKLRRGGIAIGRRIPGDRVRKKISEANPQISARAKGKLPSLLVLYSNVYLAYHTDPYHIRVGMYGIDTFILTVPKDFQQSPHIIDRRFGSKRRMTPKHNTSISAVGVIYLDPPGSLESPRLAVYHNVFAEIPLPTEYLRPFGVKQFTLPEVMSGKYQEWVEV